MEIIIAMRIVIPNDENRKLSVPTNVDVNCNIMALRITLNNPKVKTVIGKDKINNIGRTNAFKIASTKLATNAVPTLAT
jgi:hypothetical protein